MAEHRLSKRNAKIAAMLESGEGLKNFYRFIAQNEYINLHDACQIVVERPNVTVCNTMEEWNAMGRRVIKGRKSIAYYDHDGYKQFVFDANDTYGDGRYQRPILPLKHILIGLDELNGTNAYEENGRGDYRKIHNGVYTYLEKQNELTGDEQYDRLLAEGIAYSLYCKTGFPKTQNIRLHGLPYSYRENAAFVKELYIRAELMAEEIEEAYQSKQSEVEVINDIDEETVSDEPIIQSEPAEQTETLGVGRRRSRCHGTQLGTGGKEDGSLLANDFVVSVFGEGGAADIGELEDFTFREVLTQACHDTDDFGVTCQGGMVEGGGEQVVAHEDRDLVVVSGIDRGLTAAFVALIDHVVVDETCRVEHLQRGCRMIGGRRQRTERLRYQQGKHGAHHLATTASYVAQDFTQQRVRRVQ